MWIQDIMQGSLSCWGYGYGVPWCGEVMYGYPMAYEARAGCQIKILGLSGASWEEHGKG